MGGKQQRFVCRTVACFPVSVFTRRRFFSLKTGRLCVVLVTSAVQHLLNARLKTVINQSFFIILQPFSLTPLGIFSGFPPPYRLLSQANARHFHFSVLNAQTSTVHLTLPSHRRLHEFVRIRSIQGCTDMSINRLFSLGHRLLRWPPSPPASRPLFPFETHCASAAIARCQPRFVVAKFRIARVRVIPARGAYSASRPASRPM